MYNMNQCELQWTKSVSLSPTLLGIESAYDRVLHAQAGRLEVAAQQLVLPEMNTLYGVGCVLTFSFQTSTKIVAFRCSTRATYMFIGLILSLHPTYALTFAMNGLFGAFHGSH
jgi:hypothetical protein